MTATNRVSSASGFTFSNQLQFETETFLIFLHSNTFQIHATNHVFPKLTIPAPTSRLGGATRGAEAGVIAAAALLRVVLWVVVLALIGANGTISSAGLNSYGGILFTQFYKTPTDPHKHMERDKTDDR